MRLIIELLTRPGNEYARDSYVALCSFDGELLSKAGVGAGDTERQAAQESINSYFARREADATPPQFIVPPTLLECAVDPQYPSITETKDRIVGSILDRRSEVSEAGIRSFLREAIATDPTPKLTLHYEDAEGAQTVRDIYPSALEESRGRWGFAEPDKYLKAVDCEKEEPRTFRLDRITMVRTPDDE